jgi:hypothetical protein
MDDPPDRATVGAGLILAMLDTSRLIPDKDVAALCRNLTVSWSHRDYSGPVFHGTSPAAIIHRALGDGYRHVYIQSHGHVIARSPTLKAGSVSPFLTNLVERSTKNGQPILAVGMLEPSLPLAVRDAGFLVDLDTYARCGRPPALWDVQRRTVQFQLPAEDAPAVVAYGADLEHQAIYLRPEDPGHAGVLRRLLDDGLTTLDDVIDNEPLDADVRHFLRHTCTIVARSEAGVFPWNFERYDDIQRPPAGFQGPVSSLYSVAAGFKPNMILQRHGFGPRTRVVLMDYSQNALDIRRWLIGMWDGTDFPAILHRMLERFPPSETYYHLPTADGRVDWQRVRELWIEELSDWGGAEVFARHWDNYRNLSHEFVLVNLLQDPEALLSRVWDESGSVMWWSNVFFSAYALWHLSLDERQAVYRNWIGRLVSAAPNLLLYGYDDFNRVLAGVIAGRYEISGSANDMR